LGFYVYVLKSASTGRSYIGHSKDLNNRVTEHNSGKSKATRGKGPWRLVYQEEFQTRSEAMKREYYFKSRTGRIILKERGIL
jgi:putative endonuclease